MHGSLPQATATLRVSVYYLGGRADLLSGIPPHSSARSRLTCCLGRA